jgi:hypothetical protein
MTDETTLTALKRVVQELESWCDTWTPDSYTDPRISLRRIAYRAKASIPSDRDNAIVVLEDIRDQIDSAHYNILLRVLESLPD